MSVRALPRQLWTAPTTSDNTKDNAKVSAQMSPARFSHQLTIRKVELFAQMSLGLIKCIAESRALSAMRDLPV